MNASLIDTKHIKDPDPGIQTNLDFVSPKTDQLTQWIWPSIDIGAVCWQSYERYVVSACHHYHDVWTRDTDTYL